MERSDFLQVYCAISVIFFPSKFSVASIAILQQSSTTLRWSLDSVFRMGETMRRNVLNVKRLYAAEKVVNSIKDGALAYPPADEKSTQLGMAYDLR